VNDVASTNNSEIVTIAAVQNDTDADGDTLQLTAIIQAPVNGSASISENTIVYTPNDGFMGDDVIVYQISDGEEFAQAQIAISNVQTITLTGAVKGTELSSGKLTAIVNGDSTEALSDVNGNFTIDIVLDSTNGNVLLLSQGTQANDQAQAALVSFVGSTETLFELKDENNNISVVTLPALNINPLTTARYLLAEFENDQDISFNNANFEDLMVNVNATDLTELAAFIKLLIDDNNYDIPAEFTTQNFFTSSAEATSNLQIRDYLADQGLITSSGDLDATYQQDLATAMATIVEQFKQAIDVQTFNGEKEAMFVGDLKQGYLPRTADLYDFDNGTSGVFWNSTAVSGNKTPFTWAVDQNNLVLSYDTSITPVSRTTPLYRPSVVERFGSEAQQKAAEIAAGSGFPTGTVTITKQLFKDTVKVVSFDKDRKQIYRERTHQEVLILNDGNQNFNYPIESNTYVTENNVSAEQSLLADNADVLGDLVIHHNYVFTPDVRDVTNTVSRLSSDIVSFTADLSALGELSDITFQWSLDSDNNLQMDNGETLLVVTPFMSNEDGMLAAYTKYVDNELVSRYVREVYRVEQTDVTLSSLVVDLPEAYVAQSEATQADAWDTGLLDLDFLIAYNFLAGETVNRLAAQFEMIDGIRSPFFAVTWINRFAEQTDKVVNFIEETSTTYDQDTWHIVKSNSGDRIWIIEYSVTLETSNNRRTTLITLPRLNSILKTDLSEYENAWDRTIEKGIIVP